MAEQKKKTQSKSGIGTSKSSGRSQHATSSTAMVKHKSKGPARRARNGIGAHISRGFETAKEVGIGIAGAVATDAVAGFVERMISVPDSVLPHLLLDGGVAVGLGFATGHVFNKKVGEKVMVGGLIAGGVKAAYRQWPDLHDSLRLPSFLNLSAVRTSGRSAVGAGGQQQQLAPATVTTDGRPVANSLADIGEDYDTTYVS